MNSIEIARQQIDFAIKAYIRGHNLAGVATVTPAAIRILHDLTKDNPASIPNVMNELADENDYSRKELWRSSTTHQPIPLNMPTGNRIFHLSKA